MVVTTVDADTFGAPVELWVKPQGRAGPSTERGGGRAAPPQFRALRNFRSVAWRAGRRSRRRISIEGTERAKPASRPFSGRASALRRGGERPGPRPDAGRLHPQVARRPYQGRDRL